MNIVNRKSIVKGNGHKFPADLLDFTVCFSFSDMETSLFLNKSTGALVCFQNILDFKLLIGLGHGIQVHL